MLRGATFSQFEIFMAVAELGSFSGAAGRLSISSAAVSKQISALERKLRKSLFHRRVGATVTLSEFGSLLREQAPALMEKASDLAQVWNNAASSAPVVRVAANEFILEVVFRPNLLKFHLEHPSIQLELIEIEPSLQSIAKLSKVGVDLGYCGLMLPPARVPGELLAVCEVGLFISPAHPLAASWRTGSSATVPIILPLSRNPIATRMTKSLKEAKINYEVVGRAQHGEMLMTMAIHGVGACCLPVANAAAEVDAGRLVRLEVKLEQIYRYVFRSNSCSSKDTERAEAFFSDLLREEPR